MPMALTTPAQQRKMCSSGSNGSILRRNGGGEAVTEMMEGLPLLCQACGHRWHFTAEKGIIAEAFIALLSANRICPKCGNRSKAAKKCIVIESKAPSLTFVPRRKP